MRSTRRVLVAVTTFSLAATLAWAVQAARERPKEVPPREVTLSGKVVDLQSFMTGKFATGDPKRGTLECLRMGVPAALETADGLVIIGKGVKGAGREIAAFALQEVEMKGKLYERQGVRYIDMAAVRALKTAEEPGEEEPGQDEGTSETDDANLPDE